MKIFVWSSLEGCVMLLCKIFMRMRVPTRDGLSIRLIECVFTQREIFRGIIVESWNNYKINHGL